MSLIKIKSNSVNSGGLLNVDFSFSSPAVAINFWDIVTFTDLTSGTPTEWLWNFGDGYFSTLQNPTHQFLTTGTYTITLTAFDALGNGGIKTKVNLIISNGDTNASAFVVATGITDGTISNAINALVFQLKAFSIWNKMYAIYPIVGGTEYTHKFNLVNPIDSDSAYRLNFFLGWTHSSTGANSNSLSTLCSTHCIVSTLTNWITDNSMGIYNRTSTLGTTSISGVQMGLGNTSTGAQRFCLSALRSNGIPFYDSGVASRVTGTVQTDSKGLWSGVCRASNDRSLYKNGSSIGTSVVNNVETAPNYPIYLGGLVDLNGGSSVTQIQQERLPLEMAFAFVGKALSDSEITNYYLAVQTFQTALGRQV